MKLIDVIMITLCIAAVGTIAIVLTIKFAPKHLKRKIIKGICIGLLGIVVLSVGGTVAVITYIPTRLNTQYQSTPQYYTVTKPVGKALVIYQPAWTDSTKDAADALAESLQRKCYDVTVNYPGNFLPRNVSGYDVLAFGTPVYNSKGSPLVANYLKSLNGLSGKKVILFTTGSTTPMEKDRAFDGIENDIKGMFNMQRIKFSNKTDKNKLANATVNKLCENK
ncbi:flavodoxin family protein [Caproicibacterium sp. NSD3]